MMKCQIVNIVVSDYAAGTLRDLISDGIELAVESNGVNFEWKIISEKHYCNNPWVAYKIKVTRTGRTATGGRRITDRRHA